MCIIVGKTEQRKAKYQIFIYIQSDKLSDAWKIDHVLESEGQNTYRSKSNLCW